MRTPKQIIALFFILAFTAQVFSKLLILLSYYINKASYVKNCENKNRPMMHCNGKCQMMKKLKAEQKQEQENIEKKCDSKCEVTFSSFQEALTQQYFIQKEKPVYPRFSLITISNNSSDIFHPPLV